MLRPLTKWSFNTSLKITKLSFARDETGDHFINKINQIQKGTYLIFFHMSSYTHICTPYTHTHSVCESRGRGIWGEGDQSEGGRERQKAVMGYRYEQSTWEESCKRSQSHPPLCTMNVLITFECKTTEYNVTVITADHIVCQLNAT